MDEIPNDCNLYLTPQGAKNEYRLFFIIVMLILYVLVFHVADALALDTSKQGIRLRPIFVYSRFE